MSLRSFTVRIGQSACLVAAVVASFVTARGDDDPFKKEIRPFFENHCFDCHSGKEPEGKLRLDVFKITADAQARKTQWYRVQQALRNGKMPPPEEPRPDRKDVDRIVNWIDAEVLKVDCNGPRDPGRVTIRRLNRAEYNNTIRDLVGVNFRPGDDFPVDDSGYGFDNIGDVLSMSPLLFEKYLTAAEKITSAAIDTENLPDGPIVRYQAEQLKSTAGRPMAGLHVLVSNGAILAPHDFKQPGQYVVRVKAHGQQAGDEPAKMAIRLNDRELATQEVRASFRNPEVFQYRFEAGKGPAVLAVAFLNDYYNPNAERRRDRDRNLVVDYIELQGPIDADAVKKLPETHRRIIFTTPTSSGRSAEACAREILTKFGTRAYRRPLTAQEIDRLVFLVRKAEDDGDSFERGIQLALQAVLVSPNFLFRAEKDQFPREPDRVHPISEHELATRLSYFLWTSMPDDALLEQASRGTLRTNLEAEVRRMLADPKSRALVDNFAGQWLETRKLATVTPDTKQFKSFDDRLRADMRTETETFFEHILREDRSILEFLDGRYSFINERLAKHYGISGVEGEQFRRIELTDSRRGGVLTQASILTLTSNPTRTSPVKRGKWIMEQILGTPPPPPPPDVPELAEETEANATASLRQRMEVHRKNALCATCHQQMDALGFGLENFDAIGRWRDKDGKFAIDPAGTLPGGVSFNSPSEMRQKLAATQRQAFTRCLAEKLLTYATGRGVEFYDTCALDDICRSVEHNGHRFSALVLAVVQSDPFQKRRAKRPDG